MKNKKYDLVIFDFDGTLVDSVPLIARAIMQANEKIGAPACSFELAKSVIGLSLDEIFNTVAPGMPEALREPYMQFYSRYFFAHDDEIQFFDGVPEMLGELRARGYKLAIATGKARIGLERFNRRLELDALFDSTICSNESASKPDPLMINMLLERFGLGKSLALMVGDSEHDVNTANNARVDSAAVTYGAGKEEDLRLLNPTYMVDSLEGLMRILP